MSGKMGIVKQDSDNETETIHRCDSCDAHCCRYIATHIDTPTCKRDYDSIRWYLIHENVWVSIDHEGSWLLEFKTRCKNITVNHRCGDYENRPRICREYPAPDQYCERETEQASFKQLFTDVKQFENYLDTLGIDWRWKKTTVTA